MGNRRRDRPLSSYFISLFFLFSDPRLALSIVDSSPNMGDLLIGLVGYASEINSSHHPEKQIAVQIARAAQPGHASTAFWQPRDVSPVEHDNGKDWDLDDVQHEMVGEPAELVN